MITMIPGSKCLLLPTSLQLKYTKVYVKQKIGVSTKTIKQKGEKLSRK